MKRSELIALIEVLRKINEDDAIRPDHKRQNLVWIEVYMNKLINKEYEDEV